MQSQVNLEAKTFTQTVSNETPAVKEPEVSEVKIVTAQTPLSKEKNRSKFSITAALTKKEETKETVEETKADLPTNHFTETDLIGEWTKFLEKIKKNDIVVFSAINGFKLSKTGENTVLVNYPSESAKVEFEKVRAEFFNHFMHKVNHFNIAVNYKMDVALKREIMTKRKLFDKMAEINPLLRDLDDLMKFDFS